MERSSIRSGNDGERDVTDTTPTGHDPEDAAPEGTTPEGTAPEGTAPEGTTPEGTAPEGTAPEGTTPEGTAPEGTTPEGTAPEGTAPEGTDAEATPADPTPTPRRPRRLRWTLRTLLALVLAVILPVLGTQVALRINYAGDLADGTLTRGKDAIWLGHAWVDGRKKDADVKALARRLGQTGIRDLYVHSGPLEHDGTLPGSAYPRARWFIEAVHREMPGVRVQAWLGDVLATEGPTGMRLEDDGTRANVVRSARAILAVGFEGAHFDLEPLHSGDRDYLRLLDALHAVTAAQGAQLSVAAHQIDPLPGFHSFWGTVAGHPKWWSQAFFGEVARRVDQIAVMSYDTMQPLESTYGGYVAQQTSLALEATPAGTDLLMGLPFYHENRFGHWAHAETVPAAVRGVRLGLSRTDADRPNFGVALYVDFAATEGDWTAYRRDWARK
ncbi:hypothetical protein [Streptomyces sp. bgisy154]|uniref:hypothetical protein n=1 Tax=Streptomyces sp. bgisy154 TaxID=3413794 RepID=UPI003D738094